MQRRELLTQALAVGVGCVAHGLAFAQAYPAKPIKYIVPVVPGGASDMIARAVAERMGKVLGQSMVIENMGGGGGVIASVAAAKAAPDGYTLMQSYVATHGTSPATRKLPYDAVKDFSPIGMIGVSPNTLCVNANMPVNSVPELIAYMKKNTGKLSYGSAGAGTLTHLTAELFKLESKTFMVHIPYRGVTPALTDLMGGQTQVMFPSLSSALIHSKGGRLKILAVTGKSRHPAVKDVPTFEESGLKGFDAPQWYGMVGPAGMPPPLVKMLNDALNNVLSQPDFKERLSGEAVELQPMSPEAFGKFIQFDIARWTKLAKERNIQLDS